MAELKWIVTFLFFSLVAGSRHHLKTATSQQQPATEVDYGHQDVFDNSKPFLLCMAPWDMHLVDGKKRKE
jgi:hypothetical protein